jgi:hypothetical protein
MTLVGFMAIAPGGAAETYTFFVGQHIEAGTVTVTNDADNVYITYETADGWELTATNFYIGKTDPNNEVDALSSAPGQFPYNHVYSTPITSITYTVALNVIEEYSTPKGNKWAAAGNPGATLGEDIYIATHAEAQKEIGTDEYGNPIYQDESGWCEGDEFGKGWAMFATYELMEVLELENKLPVAPWTVIEGDGIYGILKFDDDGPEFVYEFDGYGLSTGTSYSLIYYADPWPGDGQPPGTGGPAGAYIDDGTTDSNGDITLSGSIELNMDLPHPADDNAYPETTTYGDGSTGAKIWLVPSSYYDATNHKMEGYDGTKFLFEMNLIDYDDTEV